jgi:hypothetical protein
MRSVQQPVCLVQQFGKAIKPGDRVYLWEFGPRIQPEPAEQLPFIRETEKFAGDQLRVKLRTLKRLEPVISQKYLLSWPELAGLSFLRCARGTNFRLTHEQAAALQKVVEGFESFFPNGNGSGEKAGCVRLRMSRKPHDPVCASVWSRWSSTKNGPRSPSRGPSSLNDNFCLRTTSAG